MRCHDLSIIGAGPAGLAAAIAAKRADLDIRIFEKGALVNSIFNFPSQMVFFTTPELLEIGGLPFVSPREKPTRDETLRYYRRVVDACGIEVSFAHTVTAVTREQGLADGPFTVVTTDGEGARGALVEPRRAPVHRHLRPSEPAGRAGRGSPARFSLLHRAAPVSIASRW